MVYLPKTEAGKTIDALTEQLNSAQFQWNTYATQLGRGYTTAYKFHQKAIDDINENLRLKAESSYWLLSLLCVAFAGGVAGGLMAPWVTKAGQVTSQLIIRNKLSAATANGISGVVQKGTDAAKPSTTPLVPAVKDPLSYWQDMLGEIGLCFSHLRADIETEMKLADAGQFSVDDANKLVEITMHDPLLADSPTDDAMPDEVILAREAEMGMWIAWANDRDLTYWNKAIDHIAKGVQPSGDDYYEDAAQFQPAVDRMRALGSDALNVGSMHVKLFTRTPNQYPNVRVLNIPALAQKAAYSVHILSGADVYMRRVAEVVSFPQKVLPELAQKAPVYKEK
jgi:hypothetical protein